MVLLINLGLSGKILTVILNININAKSCVTRNDNKSDYFMSHNGVRQSETPPPSVICFICERHRVFSSHLEYHHQST